MFSRSSATFLLVLLSIFLSSTANSQQLQISEVQDHQRLKLSDGTVWSLRMVWMPDLDLAADQLIGTPVQTEALLTNRYGETIGNLYDQSGNWLQETWIAEGKAVTWPIYVEDQHQVLDDNFEYLFEAEQEARDNELGLWNLQHERSDFFTTSDDLELDPYYLRGQFVVVEGVVMDAVARQLDDQTVIYLNFGQDYKTDFSILIQPPIYKLFRAKLKSEGLKLAELSGKSIRARGILGLYNGPSLQLTHHMAVEILQD